jgi:predicted DNA-binding transcriptional regulator YafY
VLLRLQVHPGFELQSWIKGFLPHAQVLKPAALRDAIRADVEKALQ